MVRTYARHKSYEYTKICLIYEIYKTNCKKLLTSGQILLTGDTGAEGIEADVDFLVTAVNLFDVADDAGTLG